MREMGRSLRVSRVAALCGLVISGCADPSTRIAGALTAYGLDAGQARCVGDRLERNLSVGQLRQLARAARAYSGGDTTPGRLTVSDLIRVGSRFENAEVPIEIGKAAAGCGVLASAPIL